MDKDWEIIEAMEKYGGSFVKALGNCLAHADVLNYWKLQRAFPEYFSDYKKRAKTIKNK